MKNNQNEASQIDSVLERLIKLNILIVESDFTERSKLINILDSYKLYRRTIYTSVDEAVQDILSGHLYDLVIVNESPKTLAAIEKLSKLGVGMPIVFVSYGCSVSTSFSAFEAGAADVITKPYKESDLKKLLLAAIKIEDYRRDKRLAEFFSFKNQIFFRLQQA